MINDVYRQRRWMYETGSHSIADRIVSLYQPQVRDRNAVEGKFGQGKRRFSLARIMTKLAHTSEVSILVSFIVMNLEKILSGILSFWLFVGHWLSVCLRQHGRRLENPVLADRATAA